MRTVLCLLAGVVLTAAVDEICLQMSPCGADCYTTCDNPCNCDVTAEGAVPFPIYGGRCQESGFCEEEFLHLEDCIEEGGPSCPRRMVGMNEVLEKYSSYDFRVDVRSVAEWEEGHANLSIPAPGLAKNPASNYLDKLEGKEAAKLLLYCKSGGRAFEASQNLMRYGFSNIHSFYHGGFPDIEVQVKEESERSGHHPTKNYCYITGGSDICPAPLPLSHITSLSDIMSVGGNVILVDVRPVSYKKSLINGAVRLANKKKIKKYLRKLEEHPTSVTLVLFCVVGDTAFNRGKYIRKLGWEGGLYFIDNGGNQELEMKLGKE